MEQEFHTVHDPLLPHFNDFIICHQKQIGKCFWEDTAVNKAFSILELFLILWNLHILMILTTLKCNINKQHVLYVMYELRS